MDPYDSDTILGRLSSQNYADGTPDKDSNSFNGITWWAGMSSKDDFPTLFQYALDTLSCPVMSTECERVFSSAKKLITLRETSWGRTLLRHANA